MAGDNFLFVISLTDCQSNRMKYVFQEREKGNEVLFWFSIKSDSCYLEEAKQVSRYIDLANLNIPGNVL